MAYQDDLYHIMTSDTSLNTLVNNRIFFETLEENYDITKDWIVTYFNKKFVPTNFADYDIDYQYYIKKVNEWNYQFEDVNQTNLLFE